VSPLGVVLVLAFFVANFAEASDAMDIFELLESGQDYTSRFLSDAGLSDAGLSDAGLSRASFEFLLAVDILVPNQLHPINCRVVSGSVVNEVKEYETRHMY
jgi:hypothetical protein